MAYDLVQITTYTLSYINGTVIKFSLQQMHTSQLITVTNPSNCKMKDLKRIKTSDINFFAAFTLHHVRKKCPPFIFE